MRALCTSWDLHLAHDPDDPAERAWLADRVDQAVLVTSELVTNAVVHAHSELRLLVELRGDQLHLAVQDASPHLLHLASASTSSRPRPPSASTSGALASTWQVEHPPDGGKVVACVLDLAH